MLTSDENQAIIRKSDQDARRKEKLAEAKAEVCKRFLEEEKENKETNGKKEKSHCKGGYCSGETYSSTSKGKGKEKGMW